MNDPAEKNFPEDRRIIHVDMDFFYAAIEIRDQPDLAGKPVAVGGSTGRGVLTTCNYLAREFGCRSGMPAFMAMRLCPQLIMVPTRFDVYREASATIRQIFAQFTELIEPLSLDEAYLDVSHLNSEVACVAAEVRARIFEVTGLTASAGIAPNKFLAKVASDWRKPNGQFEITTAQVDSFVSELPVGKIWGVGKATAEKMHRLGIKTCGDLQQFDQIKLHTYFGKFGTGLYHLCRGIDHREVNPNRERKSVSNERTFRENLADPEAGLERLESIVEDLIEDLENHQDREIKEGFVKLKFEDFEVTSAQQAMHQVERETFVRLFCEAWNRGGGRSVRLIGAGVRFYPKLTEGSEVQMEMF